MEQSRLLRPMGLLEIIDHTFRLYRANFRLFLSIAIIPALVMAVSSAGLLAPMNRMNAGMGARPSFDFGAFFAGFFVFMLVAVVVGVLEQAAFTRAAADRYLARPMTLKGAYSAALSRFFPFILTGLLAYLLCAFGFLLLVIPGIIFAFWCSFIVPVVMVENRSYSDAIKRSKFLVGQGVWAEVLVLVLIIIIANAVLQAAVGWVFTLPVQAFGIGSIAVMKTISSCLVGAFTGPFMSLALTLLYFNSRIRKEGFDLQVLAQEMHVRLPQPEQPQTPPTQTPGPLV